MSVLKIPGDVIGLTWVDQASWAGGDPGAGYANLAAFDISLSPEISIVPQVVQRSSQHGGPEQGIIGGYGGKLSFKLPLRGKGSLSESDFISLASKCGFSLRNNAADVNAVTGGSTSTIIGVDADLAGYEIGDAVFVSIAATSTNEIRFVSSIERDKAGSGSTTLTVEPNFTGAAAANDDLLAIDTLVPDHAEASEYLCFQVFYGESGSAEKYTLTGCAGTWKLGSTSANALPYVEFEFMCDSWVRAGTASYTPTADQGADPFPLLGDIFYIDDSAVAIDNLAFDPATKIQPYTATSGTNGRAGWLAHGEEPKVEFMPYYDSDWQGKLIAGTTFQAAFESVKSSSNAWALYLPKCQLSSLSMENASNEHIGNKGDVMSLYAGTAIDDDNGTPTTVEVPRFSIAVSK